MAQPLTDSDLSTSGLALYENANFNGDIVRSAGPDISGYDRFMN
jgi:hypothetical protein